jgi:hypothetical protein
VVHSELARRLAGLGLLTLATPLAAATREEADRLAGVSPGAVAGKVMEAGGAPLAGAKVTLRLGTETKRALTDEKGEYCFCQVSPSGGYVLEIEKEGAVNWLERDINVGRAKIAVRNVILEPLSKFRSSSGPETP